MKTFYSILFLLLASNSFAFENGTPGIGGPKVECTRPDDVESDKLCEGDYICQSAETGEYYTAPSCDPGDKGYSYSQNLCFWAEFYAPYPGSCEPTEECGTYWKHPVEKITTENGRQCCQVTKRVKCGPKTS